MARWNLGSGSDGREMEPQMNTDKHRVGILESNLCPSVVNLSSIH